MGGINALHDHTKNHTIFSHYKTLDYMIGCEISLDLLTKVQILYIKVLTSPANCNFDGP